MSALIPCQYRIPAEPTMRCTAEPTLVVVEHCWMGTSPGIQYTYYCEPHAPIGAQPKVAVFGPQAVL